MKYLIAGGSGLIGRALTRELEATGHEVKRVTRRPKNGVSWGWNVLDLDAAVAWADGVVNLAGETVVGRWNEGKKKRILESRLESTRSLVDAIRRAPKKPVVLVNASAVGYYGARGDDLLDENSPAGPAPDILAQACVATEAEAAKAGPAGVRVCCVRTGMVLSPEGGALKKTLPLFKLGLGGPLGTGAQWMSWIHAADEAGAIMHILVTAGLKGAFNLVSPNPVTGSEYARVLGKVLGRPAALKLPEGLLRFLFGEGANVMLKTQRVSPIRLREAGYVFKFPDLEAALKNLLGKE